MSAAPGSAGGRWIPHTLRRSAEVLLELAILLGVVFFALVGLAVWFTRPAQRADTPAVSEPTPTEDLDATAEPASVRDAESRPTTVFAAAAAGHMVALQDLLDANPLVSRVEQVDANGWTALHHAAYNDQLPALRYLLSRRAHVNAVAEHECVPLHMAAAQGSPEIVRILAEAGADVDVPDENGATPLHYAALPGRLEVVEALLEAGAITDMKNARQETPLDLARRLPDTRVADRLAEAGARAGSEFKMSEIVPRLGHSEASRRVPIDWHLPADGPELQEAAVCARKAMPGFLTRLAESPESRAAVRFAVTHEDRTEHVWGEIIEPGQPLHVKLSAPPMAVPTPEPPVLVSYADVLDWQLELPDGRTAGGYTQRAIWDALRAEYGFLPPSIEDEREKLVDI